MVNTLLDATNYFLALISVLPSSVIAFFSWVIGLATFIGLIMFLRGWLS